MSSFHASDILIKRRSYRASLPILVFGVTSIFGLLCLVWGAMADLLPYAGGALLFEAVGFCFLPVFLSEKAWSGEERVALRANETGVLVGEKRVLPRAAIASATVQRQLDGSMRVFLIGHSPRHAFEAVFDDLNRAKAFVSALGLEADQSTSYFRVLRGPLEGKTARLAAHAITLFGALGLLAGVIAMMRHFDSDALLLAYVPLLIAFSMARKRLRARAQVVVGADRVVLRVGRALRSIPYSSILKVLSNDDQVEVALRSGETVWLRFPSRGEATDLEPAAMTKRIEEGIRACARSTGVAAVEALIARAGRPLGEWMRALRAIGAPAHGDYRTAPVPEEALWDLVEQPMAEPTARAGAAVALAASLDDHGRCRLRAAAKATALPGVRALLEAVAEPAVEVESDERVARALEECDEKREA